MCYFKLMFIYLDFFLACSNSDGMTPVLTAASYGRCGTLKLLIEAGGDVNLYDKDGNSALYFARQSGCPVCCHLILRNSRKSTRGCKIIALSIGLLFVITAKRRGNFTARKMVQFNDECQKA
jgi:hypothetical protein